MRRTLLTSALAVLLAAVATPAQAQEGESQLGGYVAGAAGSAFSFQPYLPALLPTGDAPVETTFSLSTANVKSGGQAAGRGAIVWPGSAAANLGPLLEQAAGLPGVAGLPPPYPASIDATADDGERARALAPAVTMRAFGSPSRSEGEVRTPDVRFPGVLEIDSVSSKSIAEVTDVDVTSSCAVHLEGVSLLGGAVKFAAIHSRSVTSSTGSSATSSGDLQVVGLTIGGIAAELTADGVRFLGIPPAAGDIPGLGSAFPGNNPDAALTNAFERARRDDSPDARGRNDRGRVGRASRQRREHHDPQPRRRRRPLRDHAGVHRQLGAGKFAGRPGGERPRCHADR